MQPTNKLTEDTTPLTGTPTDAEVVCGSNGDAELASVEERDRIGQLDASEMAMVLARQSVSMAVDPLLRTLLMTVINSGSTSHNAPGAGALRGHQGRRGGGYPDGLAL